MWLYLVFKGTYYIYELLSSGMLIFPGNSFRTEQETLVRRTLPPAYKYL